MCRVVSLFVLIWLGQFHIDHWKFHAAHRRRNGEHTSYIQMGLICALNHWKFDVAHCWRSNGRAVPGPSLTERLQITHGLTRTVECRLHIYLLIYINISDSSNIVLHVDRYIRPSVDYLLFILIFWYLLQCYLHYTVLNRLWALAVTNIRIHYL